MKKASANLTISKNINLTNNNINFSKEKSKENIEQEYLKTDTNKKNKYKKKKKLSNIKSKNCGLIISFDGQNAFYKGKYKKSNIYSGVQLDIVADILSSKYNKDYIILAIDNASLHRSKELTMSNKFAPIVHDKIKNYKSK